MLLVDGPRLPALLRDGGVEWRAVVWVNTVCGGGGELEVYGDPHQGPMVALPPRFTDGLPIRNHPGTLGLQVFFQCLVIDPSGPVLDIGALSEGLWIVAGN